MLVLSSRQAGVWCVSGQFLREAEDLIDRLLRRDLSPCTSEGSGQGVCLFCDGYVCCGNGYVCCGKWHHVLVAESDPVGGLTWQHHFAAARS